MRAFVSSSRPSYAACMSAQSVSPPVGGTATACSTAAIDGTARQLTSLCRGQVSERPDLVLELAQLHPRPREQRAGIARRDRLRRHGDIVLARAPVGAAAGSTHRRLLARSWFVRV